MVSSFPNSIFISGLPPGCKVKFELEKSRPEFFVMSMPDDDEKYQVKFLNIALYVPVAQLSQPLYNQILSIQAKQDVSIHFRRQEVRSINLPRNSEEFNSTTLFLSEIPCRLTFCFVETSKKLGTFPTNPFNFQRRWSVPKVAQVFEGQTEKEIRLEQRLKQLEKELSSFKATVKGKGKGKKSSKNNSDQRPSSSRRQPYPRAEIDSDLWTDDESVRDDPETELIFIKKVELILNGAPGNIFYDFYNCIGTDPIKLACFSVFDSFQ